VGRLSSLVGSLFTAVGIGAWVVVSKQLSDEKIVVPDNAPMFAGKTVQGPASAFVQATVIQRNAEKGAGGRTFSEVADALDKAENGSDEARELFGHRASLATAASLRTSLMTSVIAFGVSLFAAGLGVFLSIVGARLKRVRD